MKNIESSVVKKKQNYILNKTLLHPEKWIANYGDYLLSIAILKTNNREVAEDLVQESFLSAIKSKDSFRGDCSEKTYLVSILNHKIIDFYRKKDVLKNTESYLNDTEESFDSHFFKKDSFSNKIWKSESYPQSWDSKADDEIQQNEFQKILEFCLSKVPSKLAPIFISKYIDDLDSEEICKEFGISTSNYWVIIHRVKLLMRSCLEKNWL